MQFITKQLFTSYSNSSGKLNGKSAKFNLTYQLVAVLLSFSLILSPLTDLANAAITYNWAKANTGTIGDVLVWSSITASADGTKLAAVVSGGSIYTSTDSGATWTEQTAAGSRSWQSITASADGTKLAAVVSGGSIYTSTDSGATWTQRTAAGSRSWSSITASADGTKLAAVVSAGGSIYTSSDSGATWTQQTAAGSRYWRSITASADGTKLAAVASGGNLYLGTLVSNGSSDLYQTINEGTITTDIRDSNNALVSNPSFDLTNATVSTSQQTTTGTLGTNDQRLSVDNPGGANNGFTFTLNATNPGTSQWSNGTNTYSYNDTPANGQLTIDPSTSTWTARVGTTTSISKGVQASFTGPTAITLATSSSALEDIWNGYVTGIGLSQTIPANTPAGNYTIQMTQTVAGV